MEHYRTLGIAFGVPSESAIEEAYHEAVKQWHPDLYENYASLRADAEEHFKQIQIAYRELKEHEANPAGLPVESAAATAEDTAPFTSSFSQPISQPFSPSFSQPFSQPVSQPFSPSFSQPISQPVSPSYSQPIAEPISSPILFGGAPGCQTAPHFTELVEEILDRHLGRLGPALAIIDLGGGRARAGSYSQFLLLASSGIMMRDARSNISLLWYRDLGEVTLFDKRKNGKLSFSQKLFGGGSGGQNGFMLQIDRSNGSSFCSISDQAEDSVKEVIYDFLLRQKLQVNP
jgi:hypothetical protein